jgi:hypothetical protein
MKIKDLFKRDAEVAAAVQTARARSAGFGVLDNYTPLTRPEYQAYEAIREGIPVVDAAINKIVRLTGGFTVRCDDEADNYELNKFLSSVQVGASGRGIDSFISAYLDQLLMYGTAVGEIVPDAGCRTVAALYNAPLGGLTVRCDDSDPLKAVVCRTDGVNVTPAPYQGLITVSALNPEPGSAVGNSMLKGLPFVSRILLKIYDSIGTNFDRMGNLRYAVTYKPSGDILDRSAAKERAMQIAEQWSSAMQSGTVKDFVAVGDVDIRVIGADNQIIDSEVPVRQMLEQIVAKTGIPPFMLGLSWSTTERMSSQQADILTSELEYYRSLLTPVIVRICDVWRRLNGRGCEFTVEWNSINLQDEVELKKARLIEAQARQIEEKLEEKKHD